MRICIVLVAVVSLCVNAKDKIEGKTLMEVYGEREEVEIMKPRLSLKRKDAKVNGDCKFPMDIILVQDCTQTFGDDWAALKDVQLPLMISSLATSHPGSRFSIMMFKDKPVEPMGISPNEGNGYYSDFCVRTDGAFHTNENDILEMYRQHTPYGGGDVYESQFVSLLAASQLPYEWAEGAVPLIVLITDAPPHFDEDGINPGLSPHSDRYDQEDPEGQCKTQYYPSPDQVKSSLDTAGLYVAVVAYDNGDMNSLVSRSWQWFVRHVGETDAFLSIMDQSSTNFWDRLSGIIQELEKVECAAEMTTPPPTTECPPCPPLPPCPTECPPCPTGCINNPF